MAAHAEGLELQERRPVAPPRPLGRAAHRPVDRQQVVPVHDDARHPVAQAAVGEVAAGVLLVRRGGEPPLVVLDHEQHRQLPHRGQVERLVEVALARGPVAGERRRHPPLALELGRERQAAGHRQHRAEVADHPDDALVERAEVEGAVAALREAALAAEQLPEEPRQVEVAPGEDAEVAVHREDGVVRLEGGDDPGGDRLLPDAREPLGEPALAEEDQHLLLDHPGEEQGAVEAPELLGRGSRRSGRRSSPDRWPRDRSFGPFSTQERGEANAGRLRPLTSEVSMARCRLHPLALAVTLLAPLLVALPSARGAEAGAAFDGGLFRELRWRPIGPFRGGRTKAATGVRGKPGLFYIGVVNGGVWKTTDYGRTWQPLFDDQPTGSIGAIAVAPSNPDVIYVGSGEGMQRPDLSTGDGIYRSTDGGKTWKHLGLRDGQQIPQIVVDPKDEKRLFVAVLGHPYGPNEERGVYRSTDGGETFQKVLYLDEDTGAADVALDPSDPATVYAVLWESRQGPWENGEFSGEGSGLYKSTDGGRSWRPLKDGLPTFAEGLGRIGITVAPSQPRRLYATVEARDKAGLYRSDDAGEKWSRVERGPARGRPPRRRRRGARPPDEPRRRLRPDDRHVEVHGRREDVHGLPRRAGRRRLPAHLDRPRPARGDDPLVGPGGGGHGQRRGDVEQLVQPADRAVLPREHGQLLPVPRVRRAAGERLGLRAQPRRRRPDHLPRLAPGGGGGVRLRRGRPARPRRGLRRQGEPVRPAHGPGAERVAAPPPRPGLPGRPDAAGSLLADRPEDPLLRVQHAVEDDGRRAALGGDQPRPDAEGLAGAGERGEVPGHPGRRRVAAGRDLHRRPVAARRGAHLGRHRRRPRPRDARRREDAGRT